MANADDLRRLAEEVASAYEERVQCLSAIKQGTADLLHAFANARDEMSKELKAKLASDERERKTQTQAEIKEREDYIEKLLADFDKAHSEMADRLRAELARVKPGLESAESERKKADQAEIKERKEAVSGMLDEFKQEQAETAAAWRELLAGMQSVRRKVTITGPSEVEAAVKVRPVKKVIEEIEEEVRPVKKAIEEIEEEGAPEEVEGGLKDRILDVLEDKPDGLKMVEIANKLGIENWRSLISIMRVLLDENRIKKEDSTYYAA